MSTLPPLPPPKTPSGHANTSIGRTYPQAVLIIAADKLANAASAFATAASSLNGSTNLTAPATALESAAKSLATAIAALPPKKKWRIMLFKWEVSLHKILTLIAGFSSLISGFFWAMSASKSIGLGNQVPMQIAELITKYNWIAACFSAIAGFCIAILMWGE